ncbi:DUF3565 domain-containing protein [Pseudomonas citronellolis]|uniref:DUF3565 domain-containing protein n=1 Tax=Pseudomonas citronellolis TaxID=53408 RepID=A0AAW6PE93_9PSED|nr:DUF3565 domain-containing protein [Pseudomonas citronellolis]MDF3844484.1 DUF3565 domain-containing protein [Pseudomonas citronellolis]
METALLAAICMGKNLSEKEVERTSLRRAGDESDPKADGWPVREPPRLLDFHQDEDGHWVAVLSCGHTQHLRHQPPWQSCPWVLDAEARAALIGRPFTCGWCARATHSDDKD